MDKSALNPREKFCIYISYLNILFLLNLSVFLGCSREREEIVDQSDFYQGSEYTVKSAVCLSGACNPIAMNSRIMGLSQGILLGSVGQKLVLKVYGFDTASRLESGSKKTRRVVVLLNKIPKNSKLTPSPGKRQSLKSVAAIEWVPQIAEEGWLEIVLRDFDRCFSIEEEPDITCNEYNFLPDYDIRHQIVPWQVRYKPGQ